MAPGAEPATSLLLKDCQTFARHFNPHFETQSRERTKRFNPQNVYATGGGDGGGGEEEGEEQSREAELRAAEEAHNRAEALEAAHSAAAAAVPHADHPAGYYIVGVSLKPAIHTDALVPCASPTHTTTASTAV